MIIGFLCLEIYLPFSHSLKEKRKRLVSIKARLSSKFNVAFSEIDYHDKWQRALIGVVTLNNQKTIVEKTLNKIIDEVQELVDGEIIQTTIKYF